MAWFDYLGGIAQGIGQASQQGLKIRAQQDEEEKARVAEELARLGPEADLTPEQVKRYSPYVGAGSFMKTPEGAIRLRQTPQQELAGYQLETTKKQRAAEIELDKLSQINPATGKPFAHAQPLDKMLMLGMQAKRDIPNSGILSPEQTQEYTTRAAKDVMAREGKVREAEIKMQALEVQLERAQTAQQQAAALAGIQQARLDLEREKAAVAKARSEFEQTTKPDMTRDQQTVTQAIALMSKNPGVYKDLAAAVAAVRSAYGQSVNPYR
jgi:hypothetical protein